MRSNFRRTLDNFYDFIEASFRKYKYIQEAKGIHKQTDFRISNEEYNQVKMFWSTYNKKPKRYWFELFNKEGEIDSKYIPNDLYYGEILPYYSNMSFRRFAEDKNLLDSKFSHFNMPQTIIKNSASIFYDHENSIIDLEKAVHILSKEKDYIIKPAIDSGGGRGVSIIKEFMSEDYIENLITKEYKSNFIIQKVVRQNKDLASLNESSINTIRILTFLFNNEVHVLSSIIRIGKPGSSVDNISAGGIQCNILENGYLEEYGYDINRNKFTETDSGIVLGNFKVPYYEEIKKLVIDAQSKQSHFKMIGWDFAVDESNKPVFIEYNVCPGNNQMTSGPHFGDLTEKVLNDVYINKKYKDANN